MFHTVGIFHHYVFSNENNNGSRSACTKLSENFAKAKLKSGVSTGQPVHVHRSSCLRLRLRQLTRFDGLFQRRFITVFHAEKCLGTC